MADTCSNPTVILARQPIYDRRLKVYAYELLYRRDLVSGAGNVGPSESASTLVRAIIEIGLDKLVGKKPAFINIPHYLLTDPAIELLPKERVVLEILEDTEPTEEALAAAQKLMELGYRIALDDYVFGSDQAAFLPFAKLVKVDLIENKGKMLNACVDQLKQARVRILAEKVETMEMYAKCQALGCHYFQGYFCSKPEIVMGKGVPSSRINLVSLLNRLQDPDVTLDELEKLISSDVGLTYRLLRMVNSVLVQAKEIVESTRGALVVLGLERVKSLVSLLALAGIENKPSELLVTAIVRAKMCEGLAPVLGYKDSSKHFTVGLLSVLDAMFDMPMSDILDQIPLSPDIKAALGDSEASMPLKESLKIALAFEEGAWEQIQEIYAKAPEISRCYLDAVEWADCAEATMAEAA